MTLKSPTKAVPVSDDFYQIVLIHLKKVAISLMCAAPPMEQFDASIK